MTAASTVGLVTMFTVDLVDMYFLSLLGEHELVAILIGIGPHKREYRRAISFKFTKTTEAKAIEIQLRDDSGKLQPKLNVVEW